MTTAAQNTPEDLDRSEVPDYHGLLRLDGKRFVVIGAGQGIGRQAAHALAGAGADLVCVDNLAERAEHVAGEVKGRAWTGDATDRDSVRDLFDVAVRELGGLDGVVDIVGIARWVALVETSDEDWQAQHDIVLRHAYLTTQYAAEPLTAAGGGSLVFVASVSGLTSAPMHAPYGSAKAGLMSLVRTAAVELGPRGIRVNAVAPGMVLTPRVAAMTDARTREINTSRTPLRRPAYPADIAAALLYLASPLSGYVTGQTLTVDGGLGVVFPYTLDS